MSPEERSANALEKIATLLEYLCPPPIIPNPPEKPWGPENISYINDETLWEIEQEEARLKARGILSNPDAPLDSED